MNSKVERRGYRNAVAEIRRTDNNNDPLNKRAQTFRVETLLDQLQEQIVRFVLTVSSHKQTKNSEENRQEIQTEVQVNLRSSASACRR